MLGDPLPKRVLLVEMPRLLRDIVQRSLAGEPGLELIVEHDKAELLAALTLHQPDVVVTSSVDGGSQRYYDLLLSHPRLRVLAVVPRGDRACAYELRPVRVQLGELSPMGLRELIRAAAHDAYWELPMGEQPWQT